MGMRSTIFLYLSDFNRHLHSELSELMGAQIKKGRCVIWVKEERFSNV